MKKFEPPVKSVILSNYLISLCRVSRFQLEEREARPTCNVQAIKKPVNCHARVMSRVIVRLYSSMITCGAILSSLGVGRCVL